MGQVLISGAGGGIGSAVVAVLASAGHEVTALGRASDRLLSLASMGVRPVIIDMREPEQLGEVVSPLDGLDALIHCAAVSDVVSIAEAGPDVWRETLMVNLASAAELTRLALPALRRSRGHVVFVNASPGLTGVPRWAPFVGSKSALRELADALRAEESSHGVRVTTVYPAATATRRLRTIRSAFGRDYDAALCIRPESLADMVGWVLAAPQDSYVSEISVLPRPRPHSPAARGPWS